MKNIAIIGAGISGLTVANLLKNHANVTLFEKSRGVSGRMSTRRAEPYFFDHGAQFFRAGTEAFKQCISPMIEEGVIARWDAHFVELENQKIIKTHEWDRDDPHYVGVPGMNAVAKYLRNDLTVHLGTRVCSMMRNNSQWLLQDEQKNELGSYDWVISTVPAEQAVALLPSYLSCYQSIDSVTMQACFSLMLGFEAPLPIGFDAARVYAEDIGWIAVNSSKPGREGAFSLLVQSTNAWASRHIDDDKNAVRKHLCDVTGAVIGCDVSKAPHQAIHGWRYANIEKQDGQTHYLDTEHNVGVCGDWLIQGSVEAAFTSGYNMANEMVDLLG